jgi:UDP-2-acetamido-3-amino-2,3-dideoxy-glucuronate N-acetyltransferase
VNYKLHASVLVGDLTAIGDGTQIWDNSQIRENASIGKTCVIGRNVYVGPGVKIGSNCKIQNNALIYEPAAMADGVFIGPGVILTNDQYPRAVNSDLSLKSSSDWDAVGVSIGEGASIGAGSVCVAPVLIGRWALVAAGSVVTRNVPDFALVGGVPARQLGWVGKNGHKLVEEKGIFKCPSSGDKYELNGETLREVTNL